MQRRTLPPHPVPPLAARNHRAPPSHTRGAAGLHPKLGDGAELPLPQRRWRDPKDPTWPPRLVEGRKESSGLGGGAR